METSYNILINELKQKKNILEKDISLLLIEKDKILNEIADQRRGISEIYIEYKNLQDSKYNLEKNLEEIKKQLNKISDDFYILTNQQREKIEELNYDISIKINQLSKYNSTILIDKQEENKKNKIELSKQRKEKQELESEKQELINFITNERIKLDNEKIQLKQKKQDFEQEYGEFMNKRKKIFEIQNKLNKFCKDNNLPLLKL